jgi:hypothetical protein
VAYALSTFLELKLYESQILKIMQEDHLQRNHSIYHEIQSYTQNIDNDIRRLQQEHQKRQESLDSLLTDSAPWIKDASIQQTKRMMLDTISELSASMKDLNTRFQQAQAPILMHIDQLQSEREKKAEEYKTLSASQQAEEYGLDHISIGGKHIRASGRRGNGPRSRILRAQANRVRSELNRIDRSLDDFNKQLQAIQHQYATRQANLETQIQHERAQMRATLNASIKQAKEQHLHNAKQAKENAREALASVTAELNKQIESRDKKIQAHTQALLSSPEFVPLRDGPIIRMMAIHKLYALPDIGDEMRHFAYIIKAFLMFLEVVPVMAKMFFSPPTVYGTMLQERTRRHVRSIIEHGGIGSREMIEQEIELEKLRIKRNHVRNERIVSDEFNRDHVRQYMQDAPGDLGGEAA